MTLIKIKQTVILSAKWVNLGIAEDKQTSKKPWASSTKERTVIL